VNEAFHSFPHLLYSMQLTRSFLLVWELGDAGRPHFHGTKYSSAVPIIHLQPAVYFQQFAFFGSMAHLIGLIEF
jgi:hypothetical protein